MSERNSLKGVGYSKWSNRGLAELVFKPAVADCDHRNRQAEALRAIGSDSSARALALRHQIQALHLLGTDSRWVWGKVVRDAVDLSTVEGLNHLQELQVSNASALVVGRTLPPVKTLTFYEVAIDELPAASELEKLSIDSGSVSRLDLGRYPKLRELTLRGCKGRVELVGLRASSLRVLSIGCSAGFDGLPTTLERVVLQLGKGASVDLSGLIRLRSLELTLEGIAMPALPAVALENLQVQGGTDVDLASLAPIKSVDSLLLSSMTALASLDGCPRTKALTLADLSALRHAVLPRHTHSLQLQRCALRDLDSLGDLPDLKSVQGWNNPALRSIAGLARAPKLARIRFSNCPRLADVSGLAACPLQDIELYHCSKEAKLDLMPLEGLKALKRLRLTRTRVGKTVIPESLHGVVVPKSLVRRSKRSASDKPLPTQARGRARKQVAKLKKLMFSRDFDRIDQCADLVGALGNDEVATAIGGGCRLERDVPTSQLLPKTARNVPEQFAATYDRLVPNRYFECGDLIKPYREHGLRALAAKAPEDTDAGALRGAEALLLTSRTKRWERLPVRVWPLASFPGLKRVAIYAASGVEDLETLEECKGLEELSFFHTDGLGDVASVCLPPKLRKLAFERCDVNALGRGDTSRIEDLEINSWYRGHFKATALELRGFRALRRLKVSSDGLDSEALAALAALPSFDALGVMGHQEHLGGFADLAVISRLRSLEVDDWSSLSQLAKIGQLEALHLRGFRRKSLAPLAKLTGLRRLHLTWCTRMSDYGTLARLPLEELVLEGVGKVTYTELKPLEALPNLVRLIDRTGKLPATFLKNLKARGVEVQST